ncbi:hypothetical protein lbkm_1096 [Lachnospiraceae bacterium KM106-2]|nr:hypothetical protein lbkm_1096 [Lachnospiraceae bacterium KM106-2]
MEFFFGNICLIGKWIYFNQVKKIFFESIAEFKLLLEALFLKEWPVNVLDNEVAELKPYILKAYIDLSYSGDDKYKQIVDKICMKIFDKHPVNQMLEAGAYYYRNDLKKLNMWFEDWLGQRGKVWNLRMGERNSILLSFVQIKEKYDHNNVISIQFAIEQAKWSVIGYASRKEYSGDYLLSWYNNLVKYDASMIYTYAKKVKEISDKITEVGDNRVEYNLNSKVFSDLFSCGFLSIKNTLQDNYYLSQCIKEPEYLVDGLSGYLKTMHLNRNELLEVWALGIGLLDWRDEDNHATIHSLQMAIEKCAKKNNVLNIYNELKNYGTAYIDLVSNSAKYNMPERWRENRIKRGLSEMPLQVIQSYYEDENTNISSTELLNALKELKHNEELSCELLEKLALKEFDNEKYGINHNCLIEYLINSLPQPNADKVIKYYLNNALKSERFYPEADLPALVRWMITHKGEEYCENGLKEIIAMQISWMSSAGRFETPEINEDSTYSKLLNWNRIDSLIDLGYQLLISIILSDDADAVRTALGGLYALLKLNYHYIDAIERDWERLHYRAKEWILMIYELLMTDAKDNKEYLCEIIRKHCCDEDFNIALYANILMKKNYPKQFTEYIKTQQDYFYQVPQNGFKNMIQVKNDSPWINGTNYVMETIKVLEDSLGENLDDIERRTVKYCETIPDVQNLITLKRRSQCKVSLNKVNCAFLRILYKDWYDGRWSNAEIDIARAILSSSEPYVLFNTPSLWKYNDGKFIDDIDKVPEKSKDIQKTQIQQLIETGVNEDEFVIAGIVFDYTYKAEVCGYMLTYLNIPDMKEDDAAYKYERNSRLLLQKSREFKEKYHCNISLFFNGVESFMHSNIMCGISKTALSCFGWTVDLNKRILLRNFRGDIIGRFELYYGNRVSSGNRYHRNQPILQRWIIRRDELKNLQAILSIDIKSVVNLEIDEFE